MRRFGAPQVVAPGGHGRLYRRRPERRCRLLSAASVVWVTASSEMVSVKLPTATLEMASVRLPTASWEMVSVK